MTSIVCDNTVQLDVSPFDTCDRCGPTVSAAVKIIVKSGELTFCGHCARTRYGLADFYIVDTYKVPDQEPVSDGACTADPPEYESTV